VIQSSTARPADCAVLMENRYGAAASTIFFIEGDNQEIKKILIARLC
jgi:hypothetical protein